MLLHCFHTVTCSSPSKYDLIQFGSLHSENTNCSNPHRCKGFHFHAVQYSTWLENCYTTWLEPYGHWSCMVSENCPFLRPEAAAKPSLQHTFSTIAQKNTYRLGKPCFTAPPVHSELITCDHNFLSASSYKSYVFIFWLLIATSAFPQLRCKSLKTKDLVECNVQKRYQWPKNPSTCPPSENPSESRRALFA